MNSQPKYGGKATRSPEDISSTGDVTPNYQDDNVSDMKTAEVLDPFGDEEGAEVQCKCHIIHFSSTIR
jgi:hypothetical protein